MFRTLPLPRSYWLYPTNKPPREYQREMAAAALGANTLVALPTGLGKTLIAAVVMLNFYRWFPEARGRGAWPRVVGGLGMCIGRWVHAAVRASATRPGGARSNAARPLPARPAAGQGHLCRAHAPAGEAAVRHVQGHDGHPGARHAAIPP